MSAIPASWLSGLPIRSFRFRAAGRVVILLLTALAARAAAQQSLERVVGEDENGTPIVVTTVESQIIGKMARAAGVPMGIEMAAGPTRRSAPKKLTGLTVRAALETIGAIDSRYEWREMNGVVVLRPSAAWDLMNHPLQTRIQPVVMRNVRARNALSVVAAYLGGPQYRDTQLGDTRRFSVQLEEGTVIDLLNAAVSAHGELAWAFETIPGDRSFPFMVMMYSGDTGFGCGVPGHPPDAPVNPARYLDPPALAYGGSPAVLDRIVGIGPNELPLVVNGPFPSAVHDLANATRVPMGIEFLGPGRHPISGSIPATGRTLREVLDAMIAVNPQYEWREMDGVIVIRPVAAWNDGANLLFTMVPPVRMIDTTLQKAVERLALEVGDPRPVSNISGKVLSLDLPQGTVLDLANAILRAHGELAWTLEPESEPPLDGVRSGYRYTFMFSIMGGGGLGFGVR